MNLKDNDENFFQGPQKYQQPQHMNTLYDDLTEKPFKFSNENRNDNNLSSSYRQQYALKFPHEQGTSLTTNQAFVSAADVAQRLKMLFPDIDNFSEQFNQNLLSIVNSRIGKILNSGGLPQQAANSNLYSINRYSPNQQQYYASSSSSNYHNNNNNNDNKIQQQEDRSHIVYVTNSRGQVEYKLNELTGEKMRV